MPLKDYIKTFAKYKDILNMNVDQYIKDIEMGDGGDVESLK